MQPSLPRKPQQVWLKFNTSYDCSGIVILVTNTEEISLFSKALCAHFRPRKLSRKRPLSALKTSS
jgi:hypothetical protein